MGKAKWRQDPSMSCLLRLRKASWVLSLTDTCSTCTASEELWKAACSGFCTQGLLDLLGLHIEGHTGFLVGVGQGGSLGSPSQFFLFHVAAFPANPSYSWELQTRKREEQRWAEALLQGSLLSSWLLWMRMCLLFLSNITCNFHFAVIITFLLTQNLL